MSYQIKLKQFEGPLDLLLSLIEKKELDITRLSLASVADQYLDFIQSRENITLESLADFLSVASKLILIKSKEMLPFLTLSEEEEEEILDLEWQLAEYRKFKDISKKIQEMLASKKESFSRESFSGMQSFFFPPENISAEDLRDTYLEVVSNIPIVEELEEEMIGEVITLEEKINHLQKFLRQKVETSFAELVANAPDKVEVIVSFLAMLEMVKQRIIHVEQGELFSDIRMKHKEI
ncbi:MAG: Segregation and condensation protein A [Candidatus Moranbacteria bacterium GW2011_GWE2_35_2-]|nr:MAG: Segregation and condensation protein A [Candidatus Moranbacteria bacterium GW2011_GWE2_35_2-]KKQ04313.1 MAG: Segregation and condensation protein A [Candidatus Moranbacteria bacterium GW2011_GWF1_36_4]KKQ21811.1 MAG: Segregation and condensation protein A [Candidatus Moranbacteria bacterium GW2011_GWF2_37_11]KKQ28874.1 MAG: Segregation and condensation protein A [Candidatus Moranbacteria bacterium GW2011_GWD1_37_17]KKQ31049.1 MAG: Segregation and condensation protein A [Candidatus Moran